MITYIVPSGTLFLVYTIILEPRTPVLVMKAPTLVGLYLGLAWVSGCWKAGYSGTRDLRFPRETPFRLIKEYTVNHNIEAVVI